MKKKAAIGIIIAAAVIAAILLGRHLLGSGKGAKNAEDAAYVVPVSQLTGSEAGLGALNRFSGVVETQETWSVEQNPDSTVKQVLVQVGDEVKAGQDLFTYDIEKFQSDQEQAEIDLERQNNELDAINKLIEQLAADQKKAPASEQSDYAIRIQDAELQKKQKELDIKSKTITIEKLKENQQNATVKSEIDGVVRSINNGTNTDYEMGAEGNAFMTIMKTGDLRIKGTINEQNIGQIMVDSPVVVHSRVDAAQTWKGVISEINTDSTVSNQNMMYYGSGDSGSNYNFYVTLESSEGLMIGQHVYVELDFGQADAVEREGIWIPLYYVDMTDPEAPFVWAASDSDKLVKKDVVLGEEDYELMLVQIAEGLTETDRLAFPDENNKEGMATMGEDDL